MLGNLGFVELILLAVFFAVPFVVIRAILRRNRSSGGRDGASVGGPNQRKADPNDDPGSTPVTVFISYRRQDSADATGRIYDRLVQQLGRSHVLKDVDSVPLGVDFRKHLDQFVSSSDIVLAIIGEQWLDARDTDGRRRIEDPADLVRIEIESALQRGIPVIPVLVRGAHMPKASDLPATMKDLAYRNGISVRPDPDFHTDADRLIAGVVAHRRRAGA
jgi:hypothetical protein